MFIFASNGLQILVRGMFIRKNYKKFSRDLCLICHTFKFIKIFTGFVVLASAVTTAAGPPGGRGRGCHCLPVKQEAGSRKQEAGGEGSSGRVVQS
jgi:hypothetical protein